MRLTSANKNTKFLLNSLNKKKIKNLSFSNKFHFKMNLFKFYQPLIHFNYFSYPFIINKIIKDLVKPGTVVGVGHTNYYSLDFSKKNKLLNNNPYVTKLNKKKESRFFYGICIAKKNNLVNSSVHLRNVFYTEIIEKNFFLFNP